WLPPGTYSLVGFYAGNMPADRLSATAVWLPCVSGQTAAFRYGRTYRLLAATHHQCGAALALSLFHGLGSNGPRMRPHGPGPVKLRLHVCSDATGRPGAGLLGAHLSTHSGVEHRHHGHGTPGRFRCATSLSQEHPADCLLPPVLQPFWDHALLSHSSHSPAHSPGQRVGRDDQPLPMVQPSVPPGHVPPAPRICVRTLSGWTAGLRRCGWTSTGAGRYYSADKRPAAQATIPASPETARLVLPARVDALAEPAGQGDRARVLLPAEREEGRPGAGPHPQPVPNEHPPAGVGLLLSPHAELDVRARVPHHERDRELRLRGGPEAPEEEEVQQQQHRTRLGFRGHDHFPVTVPRASG
ncbi:hypothetical protein AVEN_203611-1, partial [Araneus ventricosus]